MAAAADRDRVRSSAALPLGTEPVLCAGSGTSVPAEPDAPVPMNLFATWEMERCSPSCVPRLCSLTVTRLMVLKELDRELSSVIIAVKIQGSKRTLRSGEYLLLPADGLMEAELELTFTLQYPHFLKRDVNRLHVMLQRRKRYKNRTMLGYKTLAVGVINMSEVMQHPMDGAHILGLHGDLKDAPMRAALSVHALCSQPIQREYFCGHRGNKGKASDRSPDMENYSEDDEDTFSSEQEGSDDAVPPQDLYDDEEDFQGKSKKSCRKMIRTTSLTQQSIFKQKFVSLLRRFKATDEVLDSDPVGGGPEAEEDLDQLYDSLQVYDPSDSGPELDDSDTILSSPKPKLRPFFDGVPHSSSQSEIQTQKQQTEVEISATQGPRLPPEIREEKEGPGEVEVEPLKHMSTSKTGSQLSRHSWGASMRDRQNTSSMDSETSTDCRIPPPQVARKSVLDQLNHILFSEDRIPDSIILINTSDWQGQYLSELLFDQPMVCTVSAADVQAAFSAVLSRIQRFCNCNSQTPPTLKVAVAGDQSYLSTVLCCFVEQMASKTPDWLNYVRFLIIPIGTHPLAKFLASLDSRFSSLFMDPDWRDLFGRVESPALDPVGVAGRVSQYLSGAAVSHLCPISEAMLTCKHKSPDNDYCQKFVPFIGVVKVGIVEQNLRSISLDSGDIILGSPPTQSGAPITPPPSPSTSCLGEVKGLQVDYWSPGGGGVGGGGGGGRREVGMKNTLKSNFRCLQVSRISGGGELLSMTVVTREKNKKVMFLSKKTREREAESRSQLIEGISRLICTSKHQHTLRVSVDGVEWSGVRFFQLAAQWPTHVKHFPVGVFGYSKP
ncbi:phosphofurin acidic cluster sorting protein 1-like [Eleginops maclovinus]